MATKRDRSPFDDDAIREMAHAFAVALRRPHEPTSDSFNKTVKLDTNQVQDLRSKPKSVSLTRWMFAHNKNPSDITDRRLGRPAATIDLRIGAAGRHNLEDTKRRLKAAKGALEGDGRLERPAPAAPREGPPQKARAGSASSSPVGKRRKRRVKRVVNQGRHDG